MNDKAICTIAICLGLFLIGSQPASAQPMKCSGEQKTCNTNCVKIARTTVATCLDGCRTSLKICMRSGCWDTGTSRYCGLMKQ